MRKETRVNTRTGRKVWGGADSALPSCFLWISLEVFFRSPWFFQYLPKNKRRAFWCKNWRRVDFWGSIFKPPKSALSFFAELMPWRGCSGAPPHRLAGPGRSLGGGWALGGGGAGRALGGAGRALGGRRRHGSLEGAGGLKTNEAYHSKADALVIPEMYFFWKFTHALFWKCWFCKIRHLFRFASATGYDTGRIRPNRIWNASSHLAQ